MIAQLSKYLPWIGRKTVTLPAVQVAYDSGTAAQKAAFQSSVSWDRLLASAVSEYIPAVESATSVVLTFGDSRCADMLGGDGNVLLCNVSALAYAQAFSGRTAATLINRGIGGQGAAELLARVTPDLWDAGSKLVIFCVGHNDFNNTSRTPAQVWADIKTMLDGCLTRSIFVIHLGEYVGLLDSAAVRTKKAALNAMAKAYWKTNAGKGVWFDLQALIVDPASETGQPRPGTVRDGTHYGAGMAQIVGKLIAPVIASRLPASPVYLASSPWDDPAVDTNAVNRVTSPFDGSVWVAEAGAPALTAPPRLDGFGTDAQAVFSGQAGVCQIKRAIDVSKLVTSAPCRISAKLSLIAPANVAGIYCQINWYDGANWFVAPLQSNYTTVGFASEINDLTFESAPVTFTGIQFAELYLGIQASKGEAPGAESGPLLAASGTVRIGRVTIS